ncbi:TetR/AcrR family transcriptional regulator [Paraburkholderia caballeronis]|uniref:DNA-binding transcriptional regulator, AcrR family n=1 Tax=Paraburkholderia caballeronis TaxID=416943 RepID=A0A1H7L580_9BURK|nr:TetR/AcrR family transcriptional regulator [Paraburkholderia caballeronis]PXW28288.1 TetR family transcriptional regulator [Paraburkholderia caballeronis]PXX03654.1 TetR family transcriptional regulator [Paraburkholderia caballeronis]RAK04398.1 TetR family transcriptional regulator [Paraburkholderia caballeronis]SED81837.1 transcriptional regulator, TetR family [Paraburkholderia caballeronis]SEK93846.1 DNA-binding transcriptional regulator, AcrR family [Paraburkholderia caballeronis]
MVATKQRKTLPARSDSEASGPSGTSRRLAPEIREKQILLKAVEHFATHGFSGSTRELARQIGVTQPLLYRYFPSKEVLIDRVYDEVFKWDPNWIRQIKDRSIPIQERMVNFYTAYADVILRREWIRIFIFAGLTREGINTRYLARLREQIFIPVMGEVRHAYDLPPPANAKERETDQELIWSLHASIFYLGVRKWIYGLPVTDDLHANISCQIDAFLNGVPKAMKKTASRTPRFGKKQTA